MSPGIYQTADYLPLLKDKKVGLVVNHTSTFGEVHLVDSLIALGVDIQLIFSPEHGFKGDAYNGEEVADGVYKGEYPLRSLYGRSKKPSPEDMAQLDVVLFDIQDVGARFYTYISTLHYVMEAAAEAEKEVIILDRPNPNGHYIDGPVLESEHQSFVGMHEVPVVYGMTIGEYGMMINGEGWLKDEQRCSLKVIPVHHYTHDTRYVLPIAPSPNLPNERSILLYPSLCFFEGTVISEGRGTNQQFQIFGHPKMDQTRFSFQPVSMSSSKYPKHEGELCGGVDLSQLDPLEIRSWEQINLDYLITTYRKYASELDEPFFLENNFINRLSGTSMFKEQVIGGKSVEDIRASWQPKLEAFKLIREQYLMYE